MATVPSAGRSRACKAGACVRKGPQSPGIRYPVRLRADGDDGAQSVAGQDPAAHPVR